MNQPLIKYVKSSIEEVLFPKVCTICGMSLADAQQFICSDCAQNRFEEVGQSKEDKINLPEIVTGRYALWQFDKGGYLQDLLHKLKYHRLTGVGEDLGRILGSNIKKRNTFGGLDKEKTMILPVPLHKKKRRTRGFNQAFYIAKGMEDVLQFRIVKKGVVERVKNTKTQTGFSLGKRRENIADAFKVKMPVHIKGKNVIMVDDVFTTGATAFELTKELQNAKVRSVLIATIAQA